MKTALAIIPEILDILAVIVFATSLFLLSPLGKPFITQKLVQTEIQAIPALRPQASSVTSNITCYPDGTKKYEFNIAQSISVFGAVSGEVTYYSVINKIIEVYEYIDLLQSVLSLAGVYLSVRIVWICAKRLCALPFHF